MTPDEKRRNVYFSDPDLWPRIQQAAIDESARQGRVVSASEWLADAAEQKLAKEAKRKGRGK